jgi:hypothetical protein
MPSQLLIYETVVPLTFATHRHSSVEIGRSFAFSSKINSVPLTGSGAKRNSGIAEITWGTRQHPPL